MRERALAVKSVVLYNECKNVRSQPMIALKLTQIGNSVGVVLPKEALVKLGVEKGDVLYLTEASGGAMQVTPYNPDVARQIALGEEIMDDYRDTFRALAK
jgi:putative addiction module antidote